MPASEQPEVWLRGPVPDVAPLLQPVAHSLLQCREEIHTTLPGLAVEQLWARPGGAASIAYHARHAVGSLDRLLTYARGESLSSEQLEWLRAEGTADVGPRTDDALRAAFDAGVDRALAQLRATDPSGLTDARAVGRGRLPSTVVGLLFHAAEHTQRHVGQLVTTAKVIRARLPVSAMPVPTFGLTHLALGVADVERAFEFYQAVFGMVAAYRKPEFIQAQTPGARDLLVFERREAVTGATGDIAHFGFRVTDPAHVAAVATIVERAGGTVVEQGEFCPGEPYVFARDRDGYLIEIAYELPTPADP